MEIKEIEIIETEYTYTDEKVREHHNKITTVYKWNDAIDLIRYYRHSRKENVGWKFRTYDMNIIYK
ncbi:hypothetical protein SDC9_07448 [bioreactor metagenome]|uniref:Uncharacterized protein n=1 Tax=bioreactor metagenome TaxID=1076179 RepID=A0A644T518_9ZZZZ|nr:hypothetical protein [Methanobrevibacter sp.]MEA4956904.1 hypothetical protein [Methanobrevibacter sp.]